MARIVPSDLIAFMNLATPADPKISVSDATIADLSTVLDLLEGIPHELLQLDSASFSALTAARSQLRSAVEKFYALQGRDRSPHPFSLFPMPAYGNLTPLAVIRRELAKCPDNIPPSNLPDLQFIRDLTLRDTLRIDLTSTGVALAREEWKAATVLAGSVVEALLLWALGARSSEIPAALAQLDNAGRLKSARKPVARKLDEWHLPDYILVAGELDEISTQTATTASQLREFRNLIHPGAAKRTQQVCNRGTAHIAFGILHLVIEDLLKRH